MSPDGTTIYIGTTDTPNGKLYALNAATGATLWSFTTSGGIFSSPVVSHSGSIFVCTSTGFIYCLNSSGTSIWGAPGYYHLPAGTGIYSTPALNFAEDVIYLQALDGNLYCIYVAASSPSTSWTTMLRTPNNTTSTTEAPLTASPAIGADGTVYAIGLDSTGFFSELYAINPNGSQKWVSQLGINPLFVKPATVSSPSIGPDGTIFSGHDSGTFTSNSPFDGSSVVSFNSTDDTDTTAVISSAGTVYMGTDGGFVFAYNPDGSVLWSNQISPGAEVQGSGALTADGKLWIPSTVTTTGGATTVGKIYCLDASTGALLLSETIGSVPLQASSPVIGLDGTVYVAGGGSVYAFKGYGSASVPAAGFWPGFRNNSRHAADVRNNRWTDATLSGVTIIPIQFVGSTQGAAYAINDVNTVAGYANGWVNYPSSGPYSSSAFTYSSSTVLAGWGTGITTNSTGLAVDSKSRIVGSYVPLGSVYHFGFLYDPTGGTPTTSTLDAQLGGTSASVEAISPNGLMMVGASTLSGQDRATKWDSSSTTGNDLSSLNPSGLSTAYGVNDSGQLVGKSYNGTVTHGFVTQYANGIQGAQDDLGSQAGASGDSAAWAINGFNQIVGGTKTTTGIHRPFLKTGASAGSASSGTWSLAPLSGTLNGTDGVAYGINDRGQVVGSANLSTSSSTYHAFIWVPSGPQGYVVKDLNSLLNSTQLSQWTLTAAYGINNAGHIVGYGTFNGALAAFELYPN